MTLEQELAQHRAETSHSFETDWLTPSVSNMDEGKFPAPGDPARDFNLPDENGNMVSLKMLLEDGPVILSFFKGEWCSYCDLELKALQRSLPEFRKYGATLVGISPHTVTISQMLKEKKHLSYSILSDAGNEIAALYGLRFPLAQNALDVFASFGLDDLAGIHGETGENKNTLPLPGTFVIDMSGQIIYAFVDSDHTKRAEPSDIVACLMSLNN